MTGVIDIGSNSVRLAMIADGKTLYKRLETTRLGEGLSFTGKLTDTAIARTSRAVADFKTQAEKDGADKVYVFATAAVRSSSNGGEFVKTVKDLCGLSVDVISGENEAAIGLLGALKGRDGGIIDVGGASTEITVQSGGKVIYAKSVDIGSVRLFDLCARDRQKLEKVIDEKISGYGSFKADGHAMYAIGGTATTLASVKHGLKVYDPKITDGTQMTCAEVRAMADMLLSLSVEEVRAVAGMEPRRADVIGGGCLLIYNIMQRLNINKITVSESDNLEGYYMLKECGK